MEKNKVQHEVKFYDDGGHSAGQDIDKTRAGVVVKIPNDRFEEIVKDNPGTLRSQFGKPIDFQTAYSL